MSAPAAGSAAPEPRLAGVAYLFGAYLLYAVGDAAAKWLVGSMPVAQVLFVRSWLGLFALMLLGGRRSFEALRQLRGKRGLLGMNLANAGGWAAYYSAAVALPLPQLVTAYYLSPILAALLAGPMLGERIATTSWIAAGLGFAGILVCNAPAHAPLPALLPAVLGLASAACWGLTSVLYRRNVHHSSSLAVMICSNLVIGTLSALPLPWQWQALDAGRTLELLLVTGAGLAAHFLYIRGVRRVSVAVAGPIGFFSMVWSVAIAWIVWGELPRPGFYAGGALILAAGLLVIAGQWRRRGGTRPLGLS
jgi:drug/metabolite transporter (DMT)-like permease